MSIHHHQTNHSNGQPVVMMYDSDDIADSPWEKQEMDTYPSQPTTLPQKSLQLHDVLRVFRQKMHQPVGKQGSLLSGGQRQIVVLLRAVFNTHAKVLILDEPTSALDETSRDQVLKLVGEVAKGRTLVVITHDSGLVGMTEGVIRLG